MLVKHQKVKDIIYLNDIVNNEDVFDEFIFYYDNLLSIITRSKLYPKVGVWKLNPPLTPQFLDEYTCFKITSQVF